MLAESRNVEDIRGSGQVGCFRINPGRISALRCSSRGFFWVCLTFLLVLLDVVLHILNLRNTNFTLTREGTIKKYLELEIV